MKSFPVGGPREPVYNFLRMRGFVMSKWSDKVWERADGLTVSVFGSGSMARVQDASGAIVRECPLGEL